MERMEIITLEIPGIEHYSRNFMHPQDKWRSISRYYGISKHKNSGNVKLLSTCYDQIYLSQIIFIQSHLIVQILFQHFQSTLTHWTVSTNDTMNLISLLQEHLCKKITILTAYSRDYSYINHVSSLPDLQFNIILLLY